MKATLPTLAITGSTGQVGGMVARTLADAGVAQRLLVRDLTRAPLLPGAVAVQAAYSDRAAAVAALEGVETLLMVSAAENEKRLDEHRAFVESARDAGVRHIVYTSFFGAAPDATFTLGRDHFHTEGFIEAAGIDHTFLRDNLYLDFMDAMVGDDGVIRGPAGDGLLAGVARADVARVAVAALRDPAAHRNATYHLTGPEELTMTQIAAIISEVRDTTVTFHDETLEEAYASRQKWGAPDWQNDAWVSTYTSIAAGEMAGVSGDVEAVTGRLPLSLRELLRS
jgi:NAD(P)H dehydrogenase (quinone)